MIDQLAWNFGGGVLFSWPFFEGGATRAQADEARANISAFEAQLASERKSGRELLLEEVALQRTPAAVARDGLEALTWADRALYHAWRLAESLQTASDNPATAAARDGVSSRRPDRRSL